jgi:hypothetical protein
LIHTQTILSKSIKGGVEEKTCLGKISRTIIPIEVASVTILGYVICGCTLYIFKEGSKAAVASGTGKLYFKCLMYTPYNMTKSDKYYV